MFENTQRMLAQMNGSMTYKMDILPDEDGYYDKECPNDDCLSKFKVNVEDWRNLFSDEAVHCPFCGHIAPARSWWTTEQIQQAQRQARDQLAAQLGQALEADAMAFNCSQPRKSFFKMSMSYSGRTHFVNLPAMALAEMEQKIQCEKCGARYAVIGSAFYCPCCGHNSAKLTFRNTIDKVRAKINNLDTIRRAIEAVSRDEAARTCASLVETSIPDLVVAFQRLCECVYPQIDGALPLKRNVFQRLDDGNKLWHDLVGVGYDDWITVKQYANLKKCFQQRHLLQHQDGIIDQDYLIKSGDTRYAIGQRLIISIDDVLNYADIVETLGEYILALI
ncbi:hypothetical protein [uncultured Acetatifactor sp.]|jgi:hypothetical protein|uniref:hypothetical protein n=1 Tax=uncultured Acetatifactor sp. TaxID=1671927 RepID=UPI002634D698|nr:hypothetical protein [uncultured Acetatifactor sp.]